MPGLELTNEERTLLPSLTVQFWDSVQGSKLGDRQLDFLRRYRQREAHVSEIWKIPEFMIRFWIWRAKRRIKKAIG